MKPIVLNEDDYIVKFLAFMEGDTPEDWIWRQKRWEAIGYEKEDSCSIRIKLLGNSLLLLAGLSMVTIVSLAFGAGLWTILFCLFWPGIPFWDAIWYYSGLGSIMAVMEIMITGVVALVIVVVNLETIRRKLVNRFRPFKTLSKTSSARGIYELYQSFKEKYCKPVVFE